MHRTQFFFNSLNIFLQNIVLIFLCNYAFSQDLDTEQINVIKPYQPTLSDAFKISDNPRVDTTTPLVPKLNYTIISKKPIINFKVNTLKPLKVKEEFMPALSKNYVKIGMGNYTTPYGEFFVNTLRSKTYSMGAHLKHLSSAGKIKDVGYPGHSNNLISIFGKKFWSKEVLKTSISYTRDVFHLYGFNTSDTVISKNDIRQHFKYINALFNLSNNTSSSKSHLKHSLNLDYYHFSDLYKTTENSISLKANLSKHIKKENYLSLNSIINYTGTSDPLYFYDGSIISLTPQISGGTSTWSIKAGFNTVLENDGGGSFIHLYPAIDFTYDIVGDFLIAYGTAAGGIKQNTYKDITDINPFLSSNLFLRNTNYKLDLLGGLKGKIVNTISFNSSIQYQEINEESFYLNSPEYPFNKFILIYDNITLISLHGEIAYEKTEDLSFIFEANYYKYTLTNEVKPWHRPNMKMMGTASYRWRNDFLFRSDIFYTGSQYATVYNFSSTVTKLKGFVDINFSGSYNYSKDLSFFINLNNVGAFRYYQWLQYPSQRFNMLMGLSYSF